MATVPLFSRQNDAGLRAITVVLRENFLLVVVLVLESKALYFLEGGRKRSLRTKLGTDVALGTPSHIPQVPDNLQKILRQCGIKIKIPAWMSNYKGRKILFKVYLTPKYFFC